jgi:hypothetical protein
VHTGTGDAGRRSVTGISCERLSVNAHLKEAMDTVEAPQGERKVPAGWFPLLVTISLASFGGHLRVSRTHSWATICGRWNGAGWCWPSSLSWRRSSWTPGAGGNSCGPPACHPTARRSKACSQGLFANDLLPARAGEAVRCFLLSYKTDIHLPLVITSVVILRVMDGIWVDRDPLLRDVVRRGGSGR